MVSGRYKNIMKDMKNFFEINRACMAKKRLVMIIMAVALIALPTMAQDWQSTSTLQGTGSNYAPQVTEVGATGVSDMATTTTSSAPGRRKAKMDGGSGWHQNENGEWVPDNAEDYGSGAETGQANQYPLGDAVLPLMIMAMLFAGVVYTRRKKA